MGAYETSVNGDVKRVQVTDADTLRDVADLWAITDGEFQGTPSTESETLKAMLGDLQSGKPLSTDQWSVLERIRGQYAARLAAFRASPKNASEGFVPLPEGGAGRVVEAFRNANAAAMLRPSARVREAGDTPTGAMIALYPDPEVAKALALRGGEDPGDLHLTLVFLGPADGLADVPRLKNIVGRWATRTPPLSGKIVGTGTFTDQDPPVVYATPDLPGLPAARQALVDSLQARDFPPSMKHGFVPHITLAYAARNAKVDNLPVRFDHVALVLAGERLDFPLSGVGSSADAESMRLSASDLGLFPIGAGDAMSQRMREDAGVVVSTGDQVRRSRLDGSLGEQGVVEGERPDADGAIVFRVAWEDRVEDGVREYELRNVTDLGLFPIGAGEVDDAV